MKRDGTPFRLDATEAMFRITPPPAAIIFGSIALVMTNMLRTFRSKLRSQSSIVQSSSVPW